MRSSHLFCLLWLFSLCWGQGEEIIEITDSNKDTDAWKTMKEICNENGWDHEEHVVTTEDGYILTMYRIPGSLSETKPYSKRPVVLLQHGLEADALQWVINSPELAVAFIVASQGYDVWMGNNRGSRYGLGHEVWDPFDDHDEELYWTFSFEQMGLYDLPAEIDYILEQTGQSQLSYIGHSEGTTQMFIGASLNQAYFKEKVNVFVALAPIARLDHTMSNLIQLMANQLDFLEFIIADVLHYYDMFPPSDFEQEVATLFCSIFEPICAAMLELCCDLDTEVDNLDRIDTYLTHMPSGACYRNFVHYGQILNAKKFQRYDYGTDVNKKVYGQIDPPEYDLAGISGFPIALIGGSLDELGDPTDVDWLNGVLGDNVVFYHTYRLGHMSFVIAKDMSWFEVDVMAIIKNFATSDF